MHGIPIDYGKEFYAKAVTVSGGSDEKCFEAYFDAQNEMLVTLKPRVVGHFDLIRLMSSLPNMPLTTSDSVWSKVVRNLRVVVEQGGLLEVYSAGLRKGLEEPYPGRAICEVFKEMGGRFTISDDSHGVAQVGTNYARVIEYLRVLGVEVVWTFERIEGKLEVRRVSLADVKASFKE